MKTREAKFLIIAGTQGTGKSHLLKKLTAGNDRNLILPANALDEAWADFERIKAEFVWVNDPNTYGQKKVKQWVVPELDTFTGVRVLDLHDLETDQDAIEVFKFICSTRYGMKRGALMIDDYKNWIFTKGTLPRYIRSMFGDRRHRELDIFMASHSFQDMNADLMQFNPSLIVFRTTLPPNDAVRQKIRNYSELLQCIDRVNATAEKNNHYAELFTIK